MERDHSRLTHTHTSETNKNHDLNQSDDDNKAVTQSSSATTSSNYFESSFDDTDDLFGECPDTEGLGYDYIRGTGIVGYIESVNGIGAVPDPDFVTTRFEMLVIAKHWYRKLCEINIFRFQNQTTEGTDWRTAEFADRRLCRIRRLLGDGPLDRIFSEVDAELEKMLGESEWERFEAQR